MARYTNFKDLLDLFMRKQKESPKGVNLKRQTKGATNYILYEFIDPTTGKKTAKGSGLSFDDEGIIAAYNKAVLIAKKLNEVETTTEFWNWFNKEIVVAKHEIKNDSITYAQIFKKIEDKFWRGLNKNTKRKRDRSLSNDKATWYRHYEFVFKQFSNWETSPIWSELEKVLFIWEQGSKQFRDAYYVIKKIISFCPDKTELTEKIQEIDPTQTVTMKKQSISLEDFIEWHESKYAEIPDLTDPIKQKARQSWLWVAAMCVIYGLRPTEIAAAQNLTQPYINGKKTVPALNDTDNKDLVLVLGDRTYFGITIKTGKRLISPLVVDKRLIEQLKIQRTSLPSYTPKPGSSDKSIVDGFAKMFRQRLAYWKCPVTQAYAFRHLSNQLGEKYGVPQEIRARLMGHSPGVNQSDYKDRENFATELDIITNYAKQPLSLNMAKAQLEQLGFDLKDKSVQAILRIIYQIEEI